MPDDPGLPRTTTRVSPTLYALDDADSRPSGDMSGPGGFGLAGLVAIPEARAGLAGVAQATNYHTECSNS